MSREENRLDAAAVPKRRTSRYTSDPISLGLRKLWQNVEQEPVPAELLDLLDAIDAASDAASAGDALRDGEEPESKSTGETS